MKGAEMLAGLRIGQAARQSGVSEANIRFYEQQGLLVAQPRSDNRYRVYSAQDVHTLRFIRLCRALDMSLDEVRSLIGLNLNDKADCAVASQALDAHLGHVRKRLAELRALEKDLLALRARCDGGDATCHIIETLHARADQLSVGASKSGKRHV